MATRDYFTLAIREDGLWTPQFGDYNRDVVEQEANDEWSHIPRRDRTIVRSGAKQADIVAKLAAMNAMVRP